MSGFEPSRKRQTPARCVALIASVGVLGLAGCVGVLKHDGVTPDRIGAESALEAARRSTYIGAREQLRVDTQRAIAERPGGIVGPLTPARPTEVFWGLQGCLRSGERFALTGVDIRDDGVCGQSGDVSRCIPYSEMSAIASPRDATVIGYFPIMQPLACDTAPPSRR